MALNPKAQLKRLGIGTVGAIACMLALVVTSDWEFTWLFYLLSLMMVLCMLYAIPGYIGIWAWRMRKLLFDLDE